MKLSEKRGNMLHGVLLIALFSCAAFYISEFPFVKKLSFSPLIVGIILGMLYANSLRNRLPATWVPGILFCSKKILRLGIILYGFRLTFQNVVAVGLPAILIDAVVVTTTIYGGVLIGKLLKMDQRHSFADLYRKRNMRSGSHFGSGIDHKSQTLQNGRGHIYCRYLRNHLHGSSTPCSTKAVL